LFLDFIYQAWIGIFTASVVSIILGEKILEGKMKELFIIFVILSIAGIIPAIWILYKNKEIIKRKMLK